MALFEERLRVDAAASRPIQKEPSMLLGRSGKYAPRVLRRTPAHHSLTVAGQVPVSMTKVQLSALDLHGPPKA